MKTKSFISCGGDFRRKPTGSSYCLLCHRTIKEGSSHRMIHIINGGDDLLHPQDNEDYISDAGEMGLHPIGNDCAKRIGLEWSVAS